MISAAGIMYLTPDKQMLLVRRAGTSDHIGEWCFPGGVIEKGETPEEAACREAREELGDAVPDGKLYSWVRQIRDGVDFTTFVQKVDEPFTPKLNDENDAFEWRALKELVEPSPELTDTGKGNTDLVERTDVDFKESDHPRDEGGQFTDKGQGDLDTDNDDDVKGGGIGVEPNQAAKQTSHLAEKAPGPKKPKRAFTKEDYERQLLVYHGGRVSDSGHLYVTPDKALAETFGPVTAFRVSTGADIFPDPENIAFEERQVKGLESLNLGSAVIARHNLLPSNYFVWSNRRGDADFKESDHPRGQPENAGQFVEKGGGARGHLTPASANREEWPEHIANLKVPPAWTDVQLSQDADADLLVVGKDAKGRDQYVYSAKYAETQQAKKFQRIAALDSKFDKVMQQNSVNMRSKNKTVAEAAACQNLIMRMGLRPGSSKETGSEEQAYGATTLEGRHVVEEDGRVRLRFIGKKGVKLDLPVDDEKLANDLMDRAKSAGKDGRLFNISDNVLRMYAGTLDGGGFKVKDFRTYLGTSLASSLVEKAKPPANPAAYKKAVMAVAKQVSQRLGNTPSIALKAYISPLVFAPWKMAADA